MSVSVIIRRRSVGPLGHRNQELGHWLRSTIKVCSQQNRGVSAKRCCTPSVSVFHGNIKHEMGRAVPASAVKEPLLRQHVGHRARLEGRQFPFLNRGLHTLVHFSFRFSSQCQSCPDQKDRQQRPGSLRVVANRTAPLRVPKLGTVFELVHPRAVYVADKAVLAFDSSFVAIPSQDQNCGIVGNGWRSRASRQGDLSVAIHKILLDARHAGGIRILGVLCLRVPGCTQGKGQRKESRCDHLDCLSFHLVFSFNPYRCSSQSMVPNLWSANTADRPKLPFVVNTFQILRVLRHSAQAILSHNEAYRSMSWATATGCSSAT